MGWTGLGKHHGCQASNASLFEEFRWSLWFLLKRRVSGSEKGKICRKDGRLEEGESGGWCLRLVGQAKSKVWADLVCVVSTCD